MPINRLRLDQLLVERGLVQSRSRAADLIARGAVSVDGDAARKAGQLVAANAEIAIDSEANAYVARSGAKLQAGLRGYGYPVAGRVALDVGASTGGFTQVLLEAGAARVYAVDVGHGQLHGAVAADPRVVSLEGTDARRLERVLVPEPVGAIVIDVSFISLTQVLAAPLALAAEDCWLIALFKPQFEVGQRLIGKRGVVRSEGDAAAALGDVAAELARLGWTVEGVLRSPLPGKEGNVESLIGAVRGG